LSSHQDQKVVVIVSGFFSPLHIGHLNMIEAAAEAGDQLVVVVNNNQQQIAKKGKLIIDEKDRLRIVSALRAVDEAFIAVDDDRTVIESLRVVAERYPGDRLIFANGGDRKDGTVVPESEVCREYNIEMIFDMGGSEKADSSTRINMAMGVEDEASALPSATSCGQG